MSGILIMAFGALLVGFAFLQLTRSNPNEMSSFILGCKELKRDFKTKNGEIIPTKQLFKESRYVRKQILDYNVKFFSNFGAILFGTLMLCVFGSFFLMAMQYEFDLNTLLIGVPILIILGSFISKRMLMKVLVKKLEENVDKIDLSLLEESTE